MSVPEESIIVRAIRSAPTDRVVTYVIVHKAIGLMFSGSVRTLMNVNHSMEGFVPIMPIVKILKAPSVVTVRKASNKPTTLYPVLMWMNVWKYQRSAITTVLMFGGHINAPAELASFWILTTEPAQMLMNVRRFEVVDICALDCV